MIHVVFALGALAFLVQNPPQDQGGGVKTPDMDPSKKAQIDPAKEFPVINKQADSVIKGTKGYTAKWAAHEVNMTAGLDARTMGTLKGCRSKGGDMFALWEDAGVPEKKLPAVKIQAVNKKVLSVWPDEKLFERTDYAKKKDSYDPRIFYGYQYHPAKLSEDFELKVVRLALKYKAGDGAKEKPPVDDPFANKSQDFEKDQPGQDSGGANGPDPQTHHVVQLIPKDKKLKEKWPSIVLNVHYQTYVIDHLEIKFNSDGSQALTIELSDVKIGAPVEDKDVALDTKDLKEKGKK